MFYKLCRLYCFALVYSTVFVSAQNKNKTIPLNKTLTYVDKELYGEFVYLNRSSTLQVDFTDVGKNVSFIIFQVHSHLYNVTLYKTDIARGNFVTGTNIGLYSSVNKGLLDTFYVMNANNNVDLKLFITVHGYKEVDPIPGGCNMEYPVPISPFMGAINYNKTYVIVEAPPPQAKSDPKCMQTEPSMKIYFRILYLPERNFDPDVYFEAIRNMATYKNIKKYGRTILASSQNYWNMRRMVSAYPGTGAIYVAVAMVGPKNDYSIYVPTHSYACSPLVEYDCELLEDSLSMLLSASLLFLGIFICYFGHRFFKTQILAIGFLSGFVFTYILLSVMFTIGGPALVTASALSGLCIGAIRVVCWWLYGIPVFVIVLSSADIGFLVASILYYVIPGGVSYLQIDFNFWCLFILIMLLITICLLSISFIANLVCCAVVGAYTAIYPIDFYLGSNLKYILNNTIRRATVANFNKAVIMPTFQWRDWLLSFVWLALAVSGFLYQYHHNKGRPPFPPPPRSVRAVPEDPVEPILPVPSGSGRIPNIPTDHSSYFDERTPLLA